MTETTKKNEQKGKRKRERKKGTKTRTRKPKPKPLGTLNKRYASCYKKSGPKKMKHGVSYKTRT